MRIQELAIAPGLVYYYISYYSVNKIDKLVQYRATTQTCIQAVRIIRQEFDASSFGKIRRFRVWTKEELFDNRLKNF